MTKVGRERGTEVADGLTGVTYQMMCHKSDMGDMGDYHRCYYNNLVLHTAFESRRCCSTSLAWLGRPTRAAVCKFKLIKKPQKEILHRKVLFLPALKKIYTLIVFKHQQQNSNNRLAVFWNEPPAEGSSASQQPTLPEKYTWQATQPTCCWQCDS